MLVTKHTLAASSPHATPYYIVRGMMPGPVMFITSGVHGNETASMAAAQKLANDCMAGRRHVVRGLLIIVPRVNQKAYRNNRRGKPDLNRTFPRHISGKAKHPLASAVFQLASQHGPDWWLDLHEANGLSQRSSRVLGQTLITNPGSRAVPVCRRVIARMNRSIAIRDRHFNLKQHELPGSARTAAARLLHSRSVTVETCWSLKRSVRIRYQTEIVHHFLREAGLF
ncbi:succinylglutamate desuccinylase/aspartoacylase domain-containing protein [Paenibacillus pabuli]|uniref:succinylglutamate desuccinylase/aspartoacylase domain-containing protein n=1 Tax=Paenibacillus pabuli TaxID=1472 RepID=UPI00078641FB|nr:succinylglutamate desuccinylase/aspartoacylase family protein [Paenibacillus pabuli]MEC0125853.1 succinylglutamate desuccinylase/aspartoacylase family protein [Paenibacillus pabuli]